VLLFSRRGTGRCAVAMCAYLMYKYHWGFEKSYDFVYSKKPDIDINKGTGVVAASTVIRLNQFDACCRICAPAF
jgi:protein-tyrosine phosphatase